ncbi:MAG: hypothetical protein OEZ29_06175, partial [Candidatus Bathyarchaeota archaeon]|nr:hypothetical protein [Candidatus Bathyarchaeota archaeon]
MYDLLQHAITIGEKLGARLVEARSDDFYIREIRTEMDEVRDVKNIRRVGIGINVYYNGASGYSFETNPSKKAIEIATKRAYKIAKASSKAAEVKIDPGEAPSHKQKELELEVKKHPKDSVLSLKKDLVLRAVETAQEYGENIASITGRYGELFGQKQFMNSEKTEVSWSPLVVDLNIQVVSK